MKLRPTKARIIVVPDKPEEKSHGGLILPAMTQEKKHQGMVLAVGPESEVKEGDHVLYQKFSGTEMKVDGQDVLLLEAEDLLGILEDGE